MNTMVVDTGVDLYSGSSVGATLGWLGNLGVTLDDGTARGYDAAVVVRCARV